MSFPQTELSQILRQLKPLLTPPQISFSCAYFSKSCESASTVTTHFKRVRLSPHYTSLHAHRTRQGLRKAAKALRASRHSLCVLCVDMKRLSWGQAPMRIPVPSRATANPTTRTLPLGSARFAHLNWGQAPPNGGLSPETPEAITLFDRIM